jgi:hemoglobin-like flavoprotein
MFSHDMREQSRKLMAMIEVVVENLSHFDALLPLVRALGRAHASYRVRDDHYDTVETALLWTLSVGLEDQFGEADAAAWAAAYAALADTMKAAARQAGAPPT